MRILPSEIMKVNPLKIHILLVIWLFCSADQNPQLYKVKVKNSDQNPQFYKLKVKVKGLKFMISEGRSLDFLKIVNCDPHIYIVK